MHFVYILRSISRPYQIFRAKAALGQTSLPFLASKSALGKSTPESR